MPAETIAPPAAPAAPAAAPSPAPVPSTSAPPIHVVPTSTATAAPAPKPGSARERLFNELRKKAGAEPGTAAEPEEQINADLEQGAAPAVPDKKPKINPWKLLDEYKEARKKAEAEVAELRKLVPNEKDRRDELERLKQYEARAKELEEEIRYVNYTKHPEFQEKYQKPYEKAWATAMEDLKELTVTDPETDETRPIQPQDILDLVNMPLGKARELANTVFGDFADDVMAHRKEIRSLFDRQAEALNEVKKAGDIRDRERRELFQRQATEFNKFVSEVWKQANEEALKHEQFGKLFQPEEGDDEGNERLKKGFELVDKAFAENPADPNLTTEQRVAVIKRHAAVRNRAAAFGRLRYQNEKLSKRVSDLEAKLKQYESSTPSPSSSNAPMTATLPSGSARAAMMAELHKLAK